MAEVQCTKCRRPITDKSTRCEHCNTVLPVRSKRMAYLLGFVAVVLAVVALVTISKAMRSSSTDPNKSEPAVTDGSSAQQSQLPDQQTQDGQ